MNVLENGDQGLSLGLYKPKPGSKEVVECAVCLCTIEEGEEISDRSCGIKAENFLLFRLWNKG